jgi:uncharacterized membrane protein YebE (DUF533 family)
MDKHEGISRRTLVTGAMGVGAVTALGVTIARAQTATPGASPSTGTSGTAAMGGNAKQIYDDFIGKLASNLGNTDTTRVDTAVRTTLKQMVDEAQQAGLISADEATTIKQRIDSSDFPAGLLGIFERRMERGVMRGGRGAKGRMTPREQVGLQAQVGLDLAGVAGFLGITREELVKEVAQGKSLAEIAEAHGKTRDELKTYLVSQATDDIDRLIDLKRGGKKSTTPSTSATPAATPATT